MKRTKKRNNAAEMVEVAMDDIVRAMRPVCLSEVALTCPQSLYHS